MKKAVFAIFLLIFSFAPSVYAQNSVASSASVMEKETVNYDLPYPGILPDNPLYIIKVARDKLVSFLISDPLKKAEFDLLVSDKRLSAAVFLVNNSASKSALALSSITKSNNYFHEAVGKLYDAKKARQNISPLAERMTLSLKKHKEAVKELDKKIDTSYRKELNSEYKRIEDLEKYLKGIKK